MNLTNFNWGPGLFILGYHLVLLVGLPIYFFYEVPSMWLIITSAVLMYVTGLCVTAGYHRLYSHTTYKARPIVEVFLLFFATMATQGSALRWSFDHRHHHAFVDTDDDPYSIKKGFWYAHFLWLFEKPKPIDPKVVSDLIRNPLVNFQHRFYPYLMLGTNVFAFLTIGWLFSDFLGAFLFAWLTRLFFLHHFTWFINSLAHTWGVKNFSQEITAVDNYVIALLTFGEGYHNYHHTFANDYRNGIRWYHFDPTKWMIWTLHKCALVSKLKRVQRYRIDEKIVMERKELLLEKIQSAMTTYKDEWEAMVSDLTDSVLEKIARLKHLSEHYRELKFQKREKRVQYKAVRHEIKVLKRNLRKENRLWMNLWNHINSRLPA